MKNKHKKYFTKSYRLSCPQTQTDTRLLNPDAKDNFLRREKPAGTLLRSQGTDYEANLISDLWIQ